MHEDAWFCVAAERADRVRHSAGGSGQIYREMLKAPWDILFKTQVSY